MVADILRRFAAEVRVDFLCVESSADLLHFAKLVDEIDTKQADAYLSYLIGYVEDVNVNGAKDRIWELDGILRDIYGNKETISLRTRDYLAKNFPPHQEYLFLQQEGNGLLSEIVSEALSIASSDWMLLQEMRASGFRLSAIEKMIQELADDAIAVAIRLKRNAYEKLRASNDSTNFEPESISLGAQPEYKKVHANGLSPLKVGSGHRLIGLILAGGRSTRMRSTIPKAFLYLGEQSLLDRSISSLRDAGVTEVYVAVGHRSDLFSLALANVAPCIVLKKALGMGFRTLCALDAIQDYAGAVLLAYCDMPFVSAGSVSSLLESHTRSCNTLSLLSSRCSDLSGQVIRSTEGKVTEIVQQRLHSSTSSDEKDVGLYLFENSSAFRAFLANIKNNNFRGEYYFADVVREIACSGGTVGTVSIPSEQCLSINTPQDLCKARYLEYVERQVCSIPSSVRVSRKSFLSLQFFERYGGLNAEEFVKNYSGEDLENQIDRRVSRYFDAIEHSTGPLFRLSEGYK